MGRLNNPVTSPRPEHRNKIVCIFQDELGQHNSNIKAREKT
jgi:hypothetical protein